MLKVWIKVLVLIFATFSVAESLTGLKFDRGNGSCILTLYRLSSKNLEGTWTKLDSDYLLPCLNAINRPNQLHFTVATDSKGATFIAAIFADLETKVYKVAYLDPATKAFSPFKTLSSHIECFHDDVHIVGLIKFNGHESGKIRITPPSSMKNGPPFACDAKFDEGAFFGTNPHLGNLTKSRGRAGETMDDNESNNQIYSTLQQNPAKLDAMILFSDDLNAAFTLPFAVSKPPIFASGKYAIFKNAVYNAKADQGIYEYSIIDITAKQPWGKIESSYQWPNFHYIYDENAFVYTKKEETRNSAVNAKVNRIWIWSMLFVLIIAFVYFLIH